MEEEGEWTALVSISKRKRRVGGAPTEASPQEKKRTVEAPEEGMWPKMPVPVAVALGEEGVPVAKVADVLKQVLEFVQEAVGTEAAEVVVVSDSPVRLLQKARELKEVAMVSEMAIGEKLAPWKVHLKDEEVERLLPRFGVSEGGVKKSPLLICGPSFLGVPIPAPEKKRKSLLSLPQLSPRSREEKEEKDKKGEQEEGSKMEEVAEGKKKDVSLSTASVSAHGIEGPGGKMEEVREKGRVLPSVSSAAFGTEGAWSVLGDKLFEIRGEEEKILGNTSRVLKVVRSLKGKEEVESRYLQRIRELEGALSEITKLSLADQKEELGKLHQLEGRLASLALVNKEWANKNEIARGEFHRSLADVNQAHSAHVKDLQKRIRELEDDREVLREERRRLRDEVAKVREVSFETQRRKELLKSEVRSLWALVENSSGWRGRRMEDLDEAVRRAVKIVSASPVGRHVKSQATFDVLLQTLVDASILNQENIRGPTVFPFYGPKGPDRFFDAGSHCPEEIPPPRSYASWGYQLAPPQRSPEEGQTTPLEARWLG
ncbi:hypothetical protein AXF42_Ash009909 [Apostasia shenzhenica]|uniref:Uncharacterized protein n=1 Tax=Apostasia shenzhenica TaxID=1088818 RepID=A0A2I0ACB6_9ASPA|nr:hypothetical protein AXF42_Ash009909 [Apostasia shenzhenica]